MALPGAMMTQAKVHEHAKNAKARLVAGCQSGQQVLQNRRFGSVPPPSDDSMAVIAPRTEGEEANVGGSHRAEPNSPNSPPTASATYDAGTFELAQDGEL